MTGEKYGFSTKVTEHGPGVKITLPKATVESAGLEKDQLLQLKIRNQSGDMEEVWREVKASGSKLTIYLPKKTRQNLDLSESDVVDVFFWKK